MSQASIELQDQIEKEVPIQELNRLRQEVEQKQRQILKLKQEKQEQEMSQVAVIEENRLLQEELERKFEENVNLKKQLGQNQDELYIQNELAKAQVARKQAELNITREE